MGQVGIMTKNVILDVNRLTIEFLLEEGTFKAVEQVSFQVQKGRTLAIVGESGCGKSVSSLAIMGLLPQLANVSNGEINFSGKNILTYTKDQLRRLRGDSIGMIFQEPMTALNPVYTVGQQISEAVRIHKNVSYKEAKKISISILEKVRIPDPHLRYDEYPFQLSGGMKQRVLIGMTLVCDPQVLIADEPTTALDVTIQAQILELIRDLQLSYNMGIIFITHDLGVVAEVADDVIVMYSGKVIESASVYDIFSQPSHPYTRGLLNSIPKINDNRIEKLSTISGNVPSLLNRPSGCQFHPRCPFVVDKCRNVIPEIETVSGSHKVRCHRFREIN